MEKVGFIGWRGMVGSVLIKRMIDELDFDNFDSYFFPHLKPVKKILNGKLTLRINC